GLLAVAYTGPKLWWSLNIVGMLVFPRIVAPASLSRFTTNASLAATLFLRREKLTVVLSPFILKASLTVTGTPCRGPRRRPLVTSASRSVAALVASASLPITIALSAGL